jgi:hypothetical protein
MTEGFVDNHTAPRATCPECYSLLQPIKLVDHSNEPDRELEYAAGDAQRRWFLGQFPIAGKVRARMCPSCGRIVLPAEPRDWELGRSTANPPDESCT